LAGPVLLLVSTPLAVSIPSGLFLRACLAFNGLIPPASRNGWGKAWRSLWFADSPLPGSVLSNNMCAQCGKYSFASAMSFFVLSLMVLMTGFLHFFTKLTASSPDSWMKSR